MTDLLPLVEDEGLVKRFKSYIGIKDEDQCWLWLGSQKPSGYGQFWAINQAVLAHRFSWVYYHREEIPEGIFVCHHCDQPLCVNPNHLFLGTNTDNLRDASRKGRMIGVNADRQQVLEGLGGEIKDLYASGLFTQGSIAELYGVTRQSINMVCCGRRRASE